MRNELYLKMHKIMYQKVTVVRVRGSGSPVVGHTHLQNRKGTSPIVEESFCMQKVRIQPKLFECLLFALNFRRFRYCILFQFYNNENLPIYTVEHN